MGVLYNFLYSILLNNSLGWWYVSGETGEGWYPSTLLRLYSSFMPQDTTESDVVYQDTESVNRSHQPEIFYTLREYSGERDDEVSFGEGMPLRVLHKSKSGWWTVRYTTYAIKTFCMYTIKTFCIIIIILYYQNFPHHVYGDFEVSQIVNWL